MLVVFGVLIILASLILGLIILIQNPKGGGLSSSFGGIGNQLMGVKQTTDVLEKGTWLFAIIVAVLCVTSAIFIPKTTGNSDRDQLINSAPGTAPVQKQNTAPLQNTSTPPVNPNPQK
ncbi:MAG: preprotein translocase subunit SecG [Chitinophagaceae bacterium]|nr:preprotein translocase subunit SecG [Chitinophagaceae bacterium]